MNQKTMFRYVSIFMVALVLLTACGGSGSTTSVASTSTPIVSTTATPTTTPTSNPTVTPSATSSAIPPKVEENLTKTVGHLIDSPIEGANYVCADGSEGLTDANGTFECTQAPVTFKVGGLTLGVLEKFTADGNVYLQDLLGLKRKTYTDEHLKLLARLIQSLDDDGKIKEKITITQSVRDGFTKDQNVNSMTERDVQLLLSGIGKSLVEECGALAHMGDKRVSCNSDGSYYVYVASVRIPAPIVTPTPTPIATINEIYQKNFIYDSTNRVTKEDLGNGSYIEYTYDDSGNLISQTVVK